MCSRARSLPIVRFVCERVIARERVSVQARISTPKTRYSPDFVQSKGKPPLQSPGGFGITCEITYLLRSRAGRRQALLDPL